MTRKSMAVGKKKDDTSPRDKSLASTSDTHHSPDTHQSRGTPHSFDTHHSHYTYHSHDTHHSLDTNPRKRCRAPARARTGPLTSSPRAARPETRFLPPRSQEASRTAASSSDSRSSYRSAASSVGAAGAGVGQGTWDERAGVGQG